MPRWIDRDLAKMKSIGSERIRSSPLDDHLHGRLIAAAPVKRAPPRHPDDFGPTTIKAELKRFTTKPQLIHSPLREELLAEGLVRVVYDSNPPYSCLGLAITPEGQRRKR